MSSDSKSWFEGMVLYQIYPRSFQDSNGDGVGDLNGIRQRLGYLKNLGVNCLWISPFYPSPMKDFGYDISDYRGVDPAFGSMNDFDNLLREAHNQDIKIMIDLVPNHTSDQHPWFLESGQSKDNDKSDWYIWHDPKPDGSAPNNWLSNFKGPAWQWHEGRRQYYLHSFLKEQPDLNWEKPAVRQAMADVMKFWLDKGVNGFRVDAINLMGKDYSFPDEEPNTDYQPDQKAYFSLKHVHSRDAGNLFDYLRMMADVVGSYNNRLLVLETFMLERNRPELYWQFYKEINKPFCLPFNFELIFMDWSANQIQAFIDNFEAGLRDYDLPVYVLGNHDQPRFASRVGPAAARAGALLLLTLPGISLIYNGEELGMHDVDLPRNLRHDPEDREKCRTPMQWSGGYKAGFTSGQPWLPLADDYQASNADAESKEASSILSLYKTLIRLRHNSPILKYGRYESGPEITNVISFFREYENKFLLVLINTSEDIVDSQVTAEKYRLMVSTTSGRSDFDGRLQASEGVVLECL